MQQLQQQLQVVRRAAAAAAAAALNECAFADGQTAGVVRMENEVGGEGAWSESDSVR